MRSLLELTEEYLKSTAFQTYGKLPVEHRTGVHPVTVAHAQHLVPRPQRVTELDGRLDWPDDHARWLADAIEQGGDVEGFPSRPRVDIQVEDQSFQSPDAYRLDIYGDRIVLRAGGAPGRYYGLCTLEQWIQGQNWLAAVAIEDWPDFKARGVMLDISRDKVPTQDTLEEMVRVLAGWKVNQLQLYMEHTFAYEGHEVVWKNASPMTAQEIRQLDALCRRHHVELVPNQNSFGHMHRWLRHDAYKPLAEVPEGIEHAFSPHKEPFGLCPTEPGSLALLEDLYDQLLPCFSSGQFNVGLDETIDLGKGRSADLCEQEGTGRVYLEFVKQIAQRLASRDVRMQMWADIVLEHQELVTELPADITLLLWGYEQDHPFDAQCSQVAASGRPFYVCPGTSAWNAIAGRADNMIGNLIEAASAGRKHGAEGYLITDWGDNGHLQPHVASLPGWLLGAACAWNGRGAEGVDATALGALLSRRVFHDPSGDAGHIMMTLGNAYGQLGWRRKNQSEIFNLLLYPERNRDRLHSEGVTTEVLARVHTAIRQCNERLQTCAMACDDAERLLDEMHWIGEALMTGLEVGMDGLTPALAERYERLAQQHRALWLWRNRPGGLDDSAGRLERVGALLAERLGETEQSNGDT